MIVANDAHGRSIALMKFLSSVTRGLGVAEHVYVVGGAVRNFIIDQPIKDIDIVIDSVALNGRDSEWLAKKIQAAVPVRTNLTTNQYGVAIMTISDQWVLEGHEMKGEVIEIANARKESYGGAEGKGYKPHMVEPATIYEDVTRREFSFNTLLWRLLNLEHGPERAEIIDITGLGKDHLEQRLLTTPVNPDKTFSDDPTRMLRAIKFCAKYGFKIDPEVASSIRRNAPKLKQMPWNAVSKILTDDILGGPSPRRSVEIMQYLGLSHVVKEMLSEEPGMAAALSRSLNESETHLILDLLDLGWAFKTPFPFLNQSELARVREILLFNPPEFDKKFIAALKRPSIDQGPLFEKFNIPTKERSIVVNIARTLLLKDPTLADLPKNLADEVDRQLSSHYLAVKVASRFKV